MAITIEQVTHWTRPWGREGACVVVSGSNGWVSTACGHFQTGDAVTGKPKRICRKCRKKLKDVSLRPTEAT